MKEAVALVASCLDKSLPFEKKDFALYHWRLKSRVLGIPVSDQSIAEAGAVISEAERRVAADWVRTGSDDAFVDLGNADCYQ